jgi:hypothetical protein
MSRKTDGPLQGPGVSRRKLLKGALTVLGAGALIQPNGGVSGSAYADDVSPIKSGATMKLGAKPGTKGGAKTSANWNGKAGVKPIKEQ